MDQLEEVFANDRDRHATRAFLDRLAARVEAGTRVVATLRADYLGWLAESPQLSRLAERGLLLLTPLTEDELREAIEEPARLVGLMLEPGLVDVLVRDVAGASGGLPLLSHALAETWEHRESPVMTVDGYRATGGIQSAVARSAERLYDSLTPPDRDVLRTVLLRLSPPRPPVSRGHPGADPGLHRLNDAPRLLDLLVRSGWSPPPGTPSRSPTSPSCAPGPDCGNWLDEDVEGQRILAHLQVTADTWDTLGRPDDELYRGARLAAAREWRTRTHPALAPVEEDFLTAATATADAERLRQVRRNRQLRGALVAAIALLAIAFVAGTLAGLNGRRAQSEAARAVAEAARADEAAVDAVGARLSGAAVNGRTQVVGCSARLAVAITDNPTTQGALFNTLMNARGLIGLAKAPQRPGTWVFDHVVTPDGRALLQMNAYTEVHLVDTQTGISLYGALSHGGGAYPSGLIDGGRVAVVSDSRTAAGADQSGEKVSIGLLPFEVATGEPAGPRQQVPGAKGHGWIHPYDPGDLLRISPTGAPCLGAPGEGAHLAPTRTTLGRPAVRAHPAVGRRRLRLREDVPGRGYIQHRRRSGAAVLFMRWMSPTVSATRRSGRRPVRWVSPSVPHPWPVRAACRTWPSPPTGPRCWSETPMGRPECNGWQTTRSCTPSPGSPR